MNFSFFLLFTIVFYWAFHFLGALLVRTRGIKVNYTRKLIHFSLFAFHSIGHQLFPHHTSLSTRVLSAVASLISLALFHPAVRKKCSVIEFAFSAVDRPEDRPLTFTWLWTQLVLMYLVLIGLGTLFSSVGAGFLIWIPLLISAFGDGLAEPVGVAFGRHKYETHAWFTRKKFTRSWEGSLCVFLVSVVVVAPFCPDLNQPEWLILLGTVPVAATLIEAKSPHTMDQPFILAGIGAIVYLTYHYF